MHEVYGDCMHVGISVLDIGKRGKIAKMMPIIGVEKRHPFIARQAYCVITRAGNARAGLSHKSPAGLGYRFDQFGAAIAGTIIDHDRSKIHNGLRQH